MTNPKTQRQSFRRSRGTVGSAGSPDSNQVPLVTPGVLGKHDRTQQAVDSKVLGASVPEACQKFWLDWPFLVGLAIDEYLTPEFPYPVNDQGLSNSELVFGQDITFGNGRDAPGGRSVADDQTELVRKMRWLLGDFASGDDSGMAERLFDQFLAKKIAVETFEDSDLNQAISQHENFLAFSALTLAAPGTPGANPNKVRIHQALKEVNWDINKVKAITDLGVPAFNEGSKLLSTGDFNNGLGLMINGVQYVLVYVDQYYYDCDQKKYDIRLRFVLYDVFGLDDDDLLEFGAESSWNVMSSAQGITAWWQLQHQYGYAPLVTRAEVTRDFSDIPAV